MNQSNKILSDVTVWNKYARHFSEIGRRETFDEVVNRDENMLMGRYPNVKDYIRKAMDSVRDHQILPSMRCMQFAGPAIEKNESRGYNCAYLPINSVHSFSETMFLLLGGTGVGYSVQDRHISQINPIKKPVGEMKFVIADSIEGWADAVKHLMKSYLGYRKTRPRFDYSAIRPKGERLITAGGKAPGPDPLRRCLERIESVLVRYSDGDRLDSLACHDIQCHIADAVLSGGIRRAAMISLFSFTDDQMINSKTSAIRSVILKKEHPSYTDANGLQYDTNVWECDIQQGDIIYRGVQLHIDKKSGYFHDIDMYEETGTFGWWVCNPQRGRANNSVALLRGKVSKKDFNYLWMKIRDSGSGEPGVYWTNNLDWGTNPCCEIALKPFQFCNLSEINVSVVNNQQELSKFVENAAILGTLQAGFTDFHYLRPIWKSTTEEDALIGVGMTGIASGTLKDLDLKEAAGVAKRVNAEIAALIGINPAARVTTVKPSGTTSCVLGCSSGIHAWYAPYYIRRMQMNGNEAIVPYFQIYHPELIKEYKAIPGSYVLEFPIKAPEGAINRYTETAIEFLERVHKFNIEWVHEGHRSGENKNNVSCTVSIKEEEWDEVGWWMWENRESYNGISVLPYDSGTYVQPPFQEITEDKYNEMSKQIHSLDLTMVVELDDNTDLNQQLSCAGGKCEI